MRSIFETQCALLSRGGLCEEPQQWLPRPFGVSYYKSSVSHICGMASRERVIGPFVRWFHQVLSYKLNVQFSATLHADNLKSSPARSTLCTPARRVAVPGASQRRSGLNVLTSILIENVETVVSSDLSTVQIKLYCRVVGKHFQPSSDWKGVTHPL